MGDAVVSAGVRAAPIITYVACYDAAGHFVRTDMKRRNVVIRYVDGKFGWIVGMFGSLASAEKRARELNVGEAQASTTSP